MVARGSSARTAVVWEALSARLHDLEPGSCVLDIGGGTGGFAVRVAGLGHDLTVVDPSPDALAILDRRSSEDGVSDRVTGIQGDLSTLTGLVEPASFDAVLCHGVLEVVDDPVAAVRAITEVLRPHGLLSLLVGQRHAAVVTRAMAGHFQQAAAMLAEDGGPGEGSRRFSAEEVTGLLTGAGFDSPTLHAIRVFTDLVPASLVDLEPGAADALVDLERTVSQRPEYLTLATQIHALATLA